MTALTTDLFARACKIFLSLAYPAGPDSIPPPRRVFVDLPADQTLDGLLVPPLCEVLKGDHEQPRGYAIRLGSATFPHLKMQVIAVNNGKDCVFAVDTHDRMVRVSPGHPEAEIWAKIQADNALLKEQVERAWEAAGLLTFNALLRRDLEQRSRSSNGPR